MLESANGAAEVSQAVARLDIVRREIGKVIVGQQDVVDGVLICLLAGGHVLLEGVPGLGKTTLLRTLSRVLHLKYSRIQFTPDLMPADIVGSMVMETDSSGAKSLRFQPGPIFANLVLADEINRATPKTQSALLEAMQERQVTIQGETHTLARPFFVLATENPIESEGTYPLPEAQVDRFMFKVLMTYPDKDDEVIVLDRFTEGTTVTPRKVVTKEKILEIQAFTQKIYADAAIKRYACELVDATRHPGAYGIEEARYLALGASPRASIFLVLGGKAHALLAGRGYVIPEDLKAVAHDVLRHRILLTYEGEADGITTDRIIDRILGVVRVP